MKHVFALISLVAVLTSCQSVKDASDVVKGICEGIMMTTPEVQEQAQRKGVPWQVVAEAVCLANDGVQEIWQLFQSPAPGQPGKMMAAPPQQLEQAKARALAVAKQQGIIQ